MYKTNFDFIVDQAKAAKQRVRVIIAGADCENILRGAFQAEAAGFVELILAGNQGRITKMLKDLALIGRNYTLLDVPDNKNVVQFSIDQIHAGKADVLMRGNTQTRDFLLPIIDKANNLVTDKLLTQVTMVKFPDYDRVLAVSDVTICYRPDQSKRKKVIQNMAGLLTKLGYEKPNIALLALTETPAFHMPDTIEAQNIVREHNERPLANCNLVGPISYDLIVSKEAARLKGYTESSLSGEFDGIVVPDLLAGNLLIKVLQMNGHASSVGVIVGAKIPIAITSRSDTKEQSYLSLAACVAMHLAD